MYRIYNILVFPGGTEIGLEIQKSLSDCKDIVLFSAGSDASNHAPFVFRKHFVIPNIHTPNWIARLNRIIVKNKIDFVYPAYDDIIVALAKNRNKIKADVILPSSRTCLITRSKSLTYQKFNQLLPVPKIYRRSDQVKTWPVFLKPDQGQGSQNTYLAHNHSELSFYLKKHPALRIFEYLPGREYTIDCFSSTKRGLLFAGGRERVRTRAGIAMNSVTVKNPLWLKYGRIIQSALKMRGAWFYQMKADASGKLKLMEIAPRIGGTMATHRVLGVNFPLLSIYERAGIEPDILINDYPVEIDRALINRYRYNLKYDTVYIDLDDLIIFKNRINTSIITFLYQCVNQGKRIVLITKSDTDVNNKLIKYKLSSLLFDKIIHINKDDKKRQFLRVPKNKKAIFIDDSFSERTAIAKQLKIPTFDSSMIEMLIDHRI